MCYPTQGADVYFFDEPSSYLDIYERMRMVGVVKGLAEKGKRVLVVEHDLAILDVLCDLIHVIYGERSAYGFYSPQIHQDCDKCIP